MKKNLLFSLFSWMQIVRLRIFAILLLIGLQIPVANAQNPFITTWKTDNSGTSNSTSVQITAYGGETYLYDVDWNNDGTFDQFGITGTVTHDYGTAGTYQIAIKGTFPGLNIGGFNDQLKILSIDQWGDIVWKRMESAYNTATNLTYNATDQPNLTNVTNMLAMFQSAHAFNGDISGWDVSSVTNMQQMFLDAPSFNQDLSSWNVSNVTTMRSMFLSATSFNGDIDAWDVSGVTNMAQMFFGATVFNKPLNGWDVSGVTDMNYMFTQANAFNQDLNSWDVSNVTNMLNMFGVANNFNGNISAWVPSSVTNMQSMFQQASAFNQDINGWDVSNVTNMGSMFSDADAFNQDLNSWVVTAVTNMGNMFQGADVFNGNISAWDVSGVTNMPIMFNSAHAFNQNISGWNMSNKTSFLYMFSDAQSFDQDLSGWDVSNVTNFNFMFDNSGMSVTSYDNTLIGWAAQAVQTGINLGAIGLDYCNGEAARQSLIDDDGWTFTGDVLDCSSLPVELVDFRAYLQDDKTTFLTWLTSSEFNNEGYEVERSADGSTWKVLGFVPGYGTTQEEQQYSFTDERPLAGLNYYRLQQVDYDGQFEYSKIVSVDMKTDGSGIRLFPNPANGTVTLALQSDYTGEAILTLYDLSGRRVKPQAFLREGDTYHTSIELSGLSKGVYLVEVVAGSEQWQERLVVK